jgi:hypothetical protein
MEKQSSHHDSQKVVRGRRKESGQDWDSKEMPQLTYFFEPEKKFHSLQIIYSNFKSINELKHSLDPHYLHVLILSENTCTDKHMGLFY